MSSNRAPDNMPTETIRNMIRFAEQQVTNWLTSAEELRRRLDVAERSNDRYTEDVERYNEQLYARLKEERDA